MCYINCLTNFYSMIEPCPSSGTFDPRIYQNSTFKKVLFSVPDAILGNILILLGTFFILLPSVKNLIINFLFMLHSVLMKPDMNADYEV